MWVAVLVAAGTMAAPAGATAAAHTVRADVSTGGAVGNGATDGAGIAMSADGRLIAFASSATNLVAGDTNGMRDVFVRNVATGTTTRVDVGPGNVQANGDSFGPLAMSGDGRFVAFESDSSNLVAGSGCVPGQAPDCLFIRDRASGTTRVIKRVPNPEVVALSEHGRYLVTAALAGPLVRIDLHTGALVRVSCCGLGTDLKNLSFGGMSASANLITFGLDSGPSGSPGDTFQVYVRNVSRGTTTLISRSRAGVPGNNTSLAGGISPGGRYVIFASTASNLVRSDTNHAADIFIHDRSTGRTYRVDLTAAGAQANHGVGADQEDGFAMTPGARFVAFVSASANLVLPAANAFAHVYLRGPLF